MIDRTTRDFMVLEKSLKTLQGYVELSKQGRLEFAMDIPTQLFKIFFDRSVRNNDTTLYERVFGKNEVSFHQLRFVLFGMQLGNFMNFSSLVSVGISSFGENDVNMDLVDWKRPTIPFATWKDQPLQDVIIVEETDELKNRFTTSKSSEQVKESWQNPETVAELAPLIQKTALQMIKSRGYEISENPDDIHLDGDSVKKCEALLKNATIIRLSIEDFIRVIRHKDSAHADPMDNPKWQREYDQLNATQAISHWVDSIGDQVTYEKLLIAIADYLVNRLNDQLFNNDADQ